MNINNELTFDENMKKIYNAPTARMIALRASHMLALSVSEKEAQEGVEVESNRSTSSMIWGEDE